MKKMRKTWRQLIPVDLIIAILGAIRIIIVGMAICHTLTLHAGGDSAVNPKPALERKFDFITVMALLEKTTLKLPHCDGLDFKILVPAVVPQKDLAAVEITTKYGFFNRGTAFRPNEPQFFRDIRTGVCISVMRLADEKAFDPVSKQRQVIKNSHFRLCSPEKLYCLSLSDIRSLINRFHCWILCEGASAAIIPLRAPADRFNSNYLELLASFWAKCLTDKHAAASIRGDLPNLDKALGEANRWAPATKEGEMHLCKLEKGMILQVRWTTRNAPLSTVETKSQTLTHVQSPLYDRPVGGLEEEFCVETLAGDGNPFAMRLAAQKLSGNSATNLKLGSAPEVCPEKSIDRVKPSTLTTPAPAPAPTSGQLQDAIPPIGENEKKKIAVKTWNTDVIPVFERKHLMVTEGDGSLPFVPVDIRSILLARPSETWRDYEPNQAVAPRSGAERWKEVLSPRSRFILAMFKDRSVASEWFQNKTQPAYCDSVDGSEPVCDAAAVFGNLAWVEPLVVVWVNNRRLRAPVESTYYDLIPPSLVDFARLSRVSRDGRPSVSITFWQVPHEALNKLPVAHGDTLLTKSAFPLDRP